MVCLQDFHETTPSPSENTYPLVAYISSASDIQFASQLPSVLLGTWYNGFLNSSFLLDSAELSKEHVSDHLPDLKQTG
jgi:hypothetical protein